MRVAETDRENAKVTLEVVRGAEPDELVRDEPRLIYTAAVVIRNLISREFELGADNAELLLRLGSLVSALDIVSDSNVPSGNKPMDVTIRGAEHARLVAEGLQHATLQMVGLEADENRQSFAEPGESLAHRIPDGVATPGNDLAREFFALANSMSSEQTVQA